MHNSDFKNYLSDQLDIDFILLDELFEKNQDIFNVAYVLIKHHNVDKDKLGKAWGDYLGFAYVDPDISIVSDKYVKKMGVDFIKKNSALPLYKFGKAITVCTSTPTNLFIQDKCEKVLNELVSLVFCFPSDIEDYLRKNNLD